MLDGLWDTATQTAGSAWDTATSGVGNFWDRVTTPVAKQETEGTTPARAGKDPYAYAAENTDKNGNPVGYQAAAGVGGAPVKAEGSSDVFGIPVAGQASAQGPSGYGGAGSYKDPSGQQCYGARAEATTGTAAASGTVGAKGGPQAVGAADAQGPGAWAGASDNGSTAEAGYNAQVASASATAGTTGTDSDESARFGMSLGVGAAGRFHHGDADGDGRKEYGVGADFGPFSFDVKTEDPLKTAASYNPMTAPLALAGRAYEAATGKPINWTEAAGGAASAAAGAVGGAWDAATGAASSVANAAGDLFGGLF